MSGHTDFPDTGCAENLLSSQQQVWQQCADNYSALSGVRLRTIELGPVSVRLQFNPGRMASSAAKVDKASLQKRPCFLCAENRPAVQEGISNGRYELLVNPFPIFPRHFTIPDRTHTLQRIKGRIEDMVAISAALQGYTVFYNGPRCGASAPDHMHFQAGNSDFLPVPAFVKENLSLLSVSARNGSAVLGLFSELSYPLFVISGKADRAEDMAELFDALYAVLPEDKESGEPMMNILCTAYGDDVCMMVIPRRRHRPDWYGSEEGQMLVSPASVDMGGVFAIPRLQDFEALSAEKLMDLYSQLCLSPEAARFINSRIAGNPKVDVGIVGARKVTVELLEGFEHCGRKTFTLTEEGLIEHNGEKRSSWTYTAAGSDECSAFAVEDVVIGVDFHWQRAERQVFRGSVTLRVQDGKIWVINIIDVEEYLKSVISSEMSATSEPELLKAHAIISRSWLYRQIENRFGFHSSESQYEPVTITDTEIVRWYETYQHTSFSVCADDHCQRYQGITRCTTQNAAKAVEETRGLVLTSGGTLCDARFSKCCGGVFEEFESCWAPVHHPYLQARRDWTDPADYPDLTREDEARLWIDNRPDAYCNTENAAILSQVLNSYDRETTRFYRWSVKYERQELAALIKERTGIDFGDIISLTPLKRGTSGRIIRLEIRGTLRTMIIGKELEIRRALSHTHLYSSAFVVEYGAADSDGGPSEITLRGAGWGHGVGLCQIGAAVMAHSGHSYTSILTHYFPGADIEKY
ncbi:MAG: DUF4922 domain-containing protein [Muribaculaceae bacterium]|nr:DUF4922 domain-containing protein [Muribaculaceae bacterium]